METFLVFAGVPGGAAQVAPRLTAKLRNLVPRAGAELTERVWPVDELDGGVVWVGPDAAEFVSLVDVYDSSERLVVLFGALTGEQSPAKALHDVIVGAGAAWQDKVRQLDGVFSAVVIDRGRRELSVVTDAIGCRSLLWTESEGGVWFSPHAVSLVSTGRVPLQWDHCSIASAVCVEWSVGRHSLLQGLRTQKPHEIVHWTKSRGTRVDTSSPIAFDARIGAMDHRALDAHGAEMLSAVVEATQRYAAERKNITVSLTRGLDSRAVLAFLYGAGAKHAVRAQTNGGTESLDVLGAQRLAAICGVSHTRHEPPPAVAEYFTANARMTAFLNSGEANAKQSLSKPTGVAHSGSVGGGGGEIYTGFFYPMFPLGFVPDDPERVADVFMVRARQARYEALGAWSSPLREHAQRRLEESLQTFRDFGARGADLADLLYLWERYAHWGAVGYRRPWSHGWTPFATSAAVRGLFRYPRGVGKYSDLHVRAIRSYLPLRAYLMPVNGTTFLPLRKSGNIAYALRQAQFVMSFAEKKLSAALRTRASEAGTEQIWARMFADDVYDEVHALLTDPRSLATATFGAPAIQKLLNTHRQKRTQLQPLGALVALEHFRLLAERAAVGD